MSRSGVETDEGPGLGARLRRRLGRRAIVLDNRRIDGAVDQVVVAASGVWLIEARGYAGRLDFRLSDSGEGTDQRLYCGGRDRSELVASMARRMETVAEVLESEGMGVVPIRPAVCFSKP